MRQLLTIPAIVAAIVSIVGLTALARSAYDRNHPRSLSEMATISGHNMVIFRSILYPCAILFGVTIIGFIAPGSSLRTLIGVAGVVMCGSEIILATIPAAGKSKLVHDGFGNLMGAAMAVLAICFAVTLHGTGRQVELGVIAAMAVCFGLMRLDGRRFVVYELAYIYLSHASVVAVSLFLLS